MAEESKSREPGRQSEYPAFRKLLANLTNNIHAHNFTAYSSVCVVCPQKVHHCLDALDTQRNYLHLFLHPILLNPLPRYSRNFQKWIFARTIIRRRDAVICTSMRPPMNITHIVLIVHQCSTTSTPVQFVSRTTTIHDDGCIVGGP